MNILFIGDIVGRPGRDIVKRGLPLIVERHAIETWFFAPSRYPDPQVPIAF